MTILSPRPADVVLPFATSLVPSHKVVKVPVHSPPTAFREILTDDLKARAVSVPRAATAQHLQAVAAAAARSRSVSARGAATAEPMPVSFRAGRAGVAAYRILCYGDSLTVGFFDGGRQYEPYGRQLAESLAAGLGGAGVEVLVCGQSGHTAADMVSNLDAVAVQDVGRRVSKGLRRVLADQSKPVNLAVIMTGTNDLGHDFKVQGIFEDVGRLHAACHALGVPTVALAPPPAPRAGAGTSFERARLRLSDLLAAWASGDPGVNALVKPSDLVPVAQTSAWDPDGLHLAPGGSQLLGQRLAQILAPLLSKRLAL